MSSTYPRLSQRTAQSTTALEWNILHSSTLARRSMDQVSDQEVEPSQKKLNILLINFQSNLTLTLSLMFYKLDD